MVVLDFCLMLVMVRLFRGSLRNVNVAYISQGKISGRKNFLKEE